MDLHLRDLRYFEVAAQKGHLGQAAASLARSQPALTKCIQRLEAAFGSRLFERVGRGIRLTPVGEVALARARALRSAADEAVREINDFASGDAGHVRIGCGPVAADYLLPEICALTIADGRKTTIDVQVGPSLELRRHLLDGGIDILIGMTVEGDPDLISHPIVDDVVVVVASREHPLFSTRRITMEGMLSYRWALPGKRIPSRQWLDTAFTAQGLARPQVQIETSSIPMLPRMIAKTHLLSFVSRHTLQLQGTRSLKEVRLRATTLRRSLGLTTRREGYLSPAAVRVIKLLRTRGRTLFANATTD